VFVPTVRMHNYSVIAAIAIPGVLFVLDWTLRHRARNADLQGQA